MLGVENLKEHTFNTGAVTINFVEGLPSGPPLILLHGGGDRWQCFLPLIPHLAMKWHIYAIDLRGHGKSGPVPGQYLPEHYVTDIVTFLDDQLTEGVILFGHSLGGWIALMVAAECHNRVWGLILGDPPLCMERFLAIEGSEERIILWRTLRGLAGSGLPVSEIASRLADMPVLLPGQDVPKRYGDLPTVDNAHLLGWAETLSQVDPDVAQYHAEGRMDEYVQHVDLDAAMKRVSCPVLLLQADPAQGGIISDDDVKHALSLLSDGFHVRLDGIGHGLGLGSQNVAPLQHAVMKYLESL